MMKTVFKSIAFRDIVSPLFIVAGFLLLWTPSIWAAIISSVPEGGDWNKGETWVGGKVPTKVDSVVINGSVDVVNVTGSPIPIISGLEVTAGATLRSRGKLP